MDNFPSKVRFFCKKISLKPMSSKLNRVDKTFLTLSGEYCHFQTERDLSSIQTTVILQTQAINLQQLQNEHSVEFCEQEIFHSLVGSQVGEKNTTPSCHPLVVKPS